MDETLKQFIQWAEHSIPDFVAVVEEGSVAVGDPFQPGFSDHDISVIVQGDIEGLVSLLQKRLADYPLGDEYLVTPNTTENYCQGDTVNDLSLKFRSKTLVGEDVVAHKTKPSQEKALQIGTDGLRYLQGRIQRRLVNTPNWSLDYGRHQNYQIFKQFFVLFGALHYGKTGEYPSTRQALAEVMLDQNAATAALQVTNDIANASKDQQMEAFEMILSFIGELV